MLKPLYSKVIIEPAPKETRTESGIVIPETAGETRPVRGTVIAVGPGKVNDKGERKALAVKVGDIVLFKKYGPDEFEENGKKYLIADEDDIIAVIEK